MGRCEAHRLSSNRARSLSSSLENHDSIACIPRKLVERGAGFPFRSRGKPPGVTRRLPCVSDRVGGGVGSDRWRSIGGNRASMGAGARELIYVSGVFAKRARPKFSKTSAIRPLPRRRPAYPGQGPQSARVKIDTRFAFQSGSAARQPRRSVAHKSISCASDAAACGFFKLKRIGFLLTFADNRCALVVFSRFLCCATNKLAPQQ